MFLRQRSQQVRNTDLLFDCFLQLCFGTLSIQVPLNVPFCKSTTPSMPGNPATPRRIELRQQDLESRSPALVHWTLYNYYNHICIKKQKPLSGHCVNTFVVYFAFAVCSFPSNPLTPWHTVATCEALSIPFSFNGTDTFPSTLSSWLHDFVYATGLAPPLHSHVGFVKTNHTH